MLLIVRATVACFAWKGNVYKRKRFCMRSHVEELTGRQFVRMYRMNYNTFSNLKTLIAPACHRGERHNSQTAPAVSVDVMLCVTLRVLAGASYLDVSWPYGIAISTVYLVFNDTIAAIDHALGNIRFPKTEEDCRIQSDKFRELRSSPIAGVIGALDGIAVEIRQPQVCDVPDPRKYYNRKGFFGIVVQAVASADYKFTFVSATHAGSTHDSTAFQATTLHTLLRKHTLPSWAHLVCDDAYGLDDHLLTPYSGSALTTRQDSYNYYHSSCRIVVEQSFGILVNRWGILWSALRCRLAKATDVIVVCFKLHNFIMDSQHEDQFNVIPPHEHNHVHGEPFVHIQELCHDEPWIRRARQPGRQRHAFRDGIADGLQSLGYIRHRSG